MPPEPDLNSGRPLSVDFVHFGRFCQVSFGIKKLLHKGVLTDVGVKRRNHPQQTLMEEGSLHKTTD